MQGTAYRGPCGIKGNNDHRSDIDRMKSNNVVNGATFTLPKVIEPSGGVLEFLVLTAKYCYGSVNRNAQPPSPILL